MSPAPRSRLKNASSCVTESRMLALCSPALAFFGIRAVAEQPLEGHARIHFRRQRLYRRRPRHAVRVGAAVAPVAVAEVAVLFDAELNRRQDGALAVLLRDQLVDRNAQVRADGISARAR